MDLAAARTRGIPVAHVPGTESGNAAAVAEIAILHMLALPRRYRQAQGSVAERKLEHPCGSTLGGKTVAVIGVGAIDGAARSHIVVACCPLTEQTCGPIVDYAALLGALRSGQPADAGIDVAWNEPIAHRVD